MSSFELLGQGIAWAVGRIRAAAFVGGWRCFEKRSRFGSRYLRLWHPSRGQLTVRVSDHREGSRHSVQFSFWGVTDEAAFREVLKFLAGRVGLGVLSVDRAAVPDASRGVGRPGIGTPSPEGALPDQSHAAGGTLVRGQV